MSRNSGILMHISSLSGEHGIGTMGKEAYKFADFLNETGQKYWQILPIGHTTYGDSPYQAFSAFAGNPYFIDLKTLIEDGFLAESDLVGIDFGFDGSKIEYGKIFNEKYTILRLAFENAKSLLGDEIYVELDKFSEDSFWLEDYVLYMAIKEKMELAKWQDWDEDIKLRKKSAVSKYKKELKDNIDFWKFVQWQFYKQWTSLKSYVNSLGIEIIGDLPIYVSSDSSDAWANSKIFKLDENKNPITVAGCPPDYFSETGQFWGNPIYDWEYLDKKGYKWWISRIKENLKLYDVVRIDHFRGFEAFWEIPFGEETAVNGYWTKGPEMKLFNAIKKELGDIKIIAEDLGFLTQEVFEFRNNTGYPGMKILQFAFSPDGSSDYVPHKYDKNCIVYTGTHDNDTIRGWFENSGSQEEIEFCEKYLMLSEQEGYNWGFIRGAWSSPANIAITTMQDLLGLDSSTRMNEPSTFGSNWCWRMQKGSITQEVKDKLLGLTKTYGRLK
ncbi:MAG: 4-alpha-glucanotransferase [bacterium]